MMKSHLPCLAKKISDELVPILGHCPNCQTQFIWGELIQTMKIRMRHALQQQGIVVENEGEEEEEEEHTLDDSIELIENHPTMLDLDSDSSESSVINLT